LSLTSQNPLDASFTSKMREAGLPDAAAAAFRFHLESYLAGETGVLGRDRIEPIGDLPDAAAFDRAQPIDEGLLGRTVVIKLNGGLGTSMGLETAKSLIEVRPGATFLDLIARQVLDLRGRTGKRIPLLLMNSFRTADDTAGLLSAYPGLEVDGIPMAFMQHKIPKILVADATPAAWPDDPDLEWCPPGHGDLYTALATS
jgi:UTP--glucose-1-phosphate uridylyltransferase